MILSFEILRSAQNDKTMSIISNWKRYKPFLEHRPIAMLRAYIIIIQGGGQQKKEKSFSLIFGLEAGMIVTVGSWNWWWELLELQ
jgi:hypothetical protein